MLYLFPTVSALVSILFFFVGSSQFVGWIAYWIGKSDSIRNRFAIGAAVLELIAISLCIEAANVSNVAKGVIEPSTHYSLAILFPLVLLFVVSQQALWFTDHQWKLASQERERHLTRQLQESEQTLHESEATTNLFLHFRQRSVG